MDNVWITYDQKPELNRPIFIEGLPGVGNVGKLAAEHLLDELGGEKMADIYSKFFPPQVLVSDDGVTKLVQNELYFYKRDEDSGGKDIIFLTGDYQGLSPEGQYELSGRMIDIAKEYDVPRIYTLGGYGLGALVEEPRVLGAATTTELVEEMKEFGVEFSKGEPGSGIVGASGLLLGLGSVEDIEGVCLMGETSGYFVDPKSAQAVLQILCKILDVEIKYTKLEDKAQRIERITSQIQNMEPNMDSGGKDEDLHYIG